MRSAFRFAMNARRGKGKSKQSEDSSSTTINNNNNNNNNKRSQLLSLQVELVKAKANLTKQRHYRHPENQVPLLHVEDMSRASEVFPCDELSSESGCTQEPSGETLEEASVCRPLPLFPGMRQREPTGFTSDDDYIEAIESLLPLLPERRCSRTFCCHDETTVEGDSLAPTALAVGPDTDADCCSHHATVQLQMDDDMLDAEQRIQFLTGRLEQACDLIETLFRHVRTLQQQNEDLVALTECSFSSITSKESNHTDTVPAKQKSLEDVELLLEQYLLLKYGIVLGLIFYVCGQTEVFLALAIFLWLTLESISIST